MNKGLDLIKRQQPEIIDGFPTGNIFIGVTKEELTELEKELKDYQEIKEIAKRYNWDDITNEIFNVKTDKKYRDLFNGAIADIQKDYRKARALEIIKNKGIDLIELRNCKKAKTYNENTKRTYCEEYTDEEFDLLREVLL